MKIARNFSSPYNENSFKEYMQGSSLTLATCWKLTSVEGRVVAATSHTRDIVLAEHDGRTFISAQGVVPSAVDNEAGLSSAGLEVDAVFAVNIIDEESIAAGDWDSAFFEVFLVNYSDLAMGEMVMFAGYLGEIKTYGERFRAEGKPLSNKASQEIGDVFTAKCTVEVLGDSRCKKNIDIGQNAEDGGPITVTGTVTTAGVMEFVDSSRTQLSGYFDYGVIEFTSGIFEGKKAEVRSYITGGTFKLQIPMTREIPVGTTYTATRGCDRTWTTCKNVFNNLINFRGFPFVPGIEKAYKINR